MNNRFTIFLRDLLIFITACLITYKLPTLLIFLLNSEWLLLNLPVVAIGAIYSIIHASLVSDHLSGTIFIILLGIILITCYIQSFILADTFGKILCAMGIIGIISEVIKDLK